MTVRVVIAISAWLSVTRRPTVFVPTVVNAIVVMALVAVSISKWPSPSKSHSYRRIVPSASADVAALKRMFWLIIAVFDDVTNAAVGGAPGRIPVCVT